MRACRRDHIVEAWTAFSWDRVPRWLIEAMLTGELRRDEQTDEVWVMYPVKRKVEPGDVIIRNSVLELVVLKDDEFDRDYVWLEESRIPPDIKSYSELDS